MGPAAPPHPATHRAAGPGTPRSAPCSPSPETPPETTSRFPCTAIKESLKPGNISEIKHLMSSVLKPRAGCQFGTGCGPCPSHNGRWGCSAWLLDPTKPSRFPHRGSGAVSTKQVPRCCHQSDGGWRPQEGGEAGRCELRPRAPGHLGTDPYSLQSRSVLLPEYPFSDLVLLRGSVFLHPPPAGRDLKGRIHPPCNTFVPGTTAAAEPLAEQQHRALLAARTRAEGQAEGTLLKGLALTAQSQHLPVPAQPPSPAQSQPIPAPARSIGSQPACAAPQEAPALQPSSCWPDPHRSLPSTALLPAIKIYRI